MLVSANMAVAAAREGRKTLVADKTRRSTMAVPEPPPPVIGVKASAARPTRFAAENAGVDLLIIDTRSSSLEDSIDAAKAADLTLVVVLAGPPLPPARFCPDYKPAFQRTVGMQGVSICIRCRDARNGAACASNAHPIACGTGSRGGIMKVLITGGTGFIGAQLAKRILALGALTGLSGKQEPVDEIVLFDVALPEKPIPGLDDKRIKIQAGNIADRAVVDRLVDRADIGVFHLASIVSGQGEQDFDLAMRVNLDGNLNLLEVLRAENSKPRIVFASSGAVFGGPGMPKTVGDRPSSCRKPPTA